MRSGSGGKRDTRPSSAPRTRTSRWRSFDCLRGALRSSDKLTIAVRSSGSSASRRSTRDSGGFSSGKLSDLSLSVTRFSLPWADPPRVSDVPSHLCPRVALRWSMALSGSSACSATFSPVQPLLATEHRSWADDSAAFLLHGKFSETDRDVGVAELPWCALPRGRTKIPRKHDAHLFGNFGGRGVVGLDDTERHAAKATFSPVSE